jgi:hypothetical protein
MTTAPVPPRSNSRSTINSIVHLPERIRITLISSRSHSRRAPATHDDIAALRRERADLLERERAQQFLHIPR